MSFHSGTKKQHSTNLSVLILFYFLHLHWYLSFHSGTKKQHSSTWSLDFWNISTVSQQEQHIQFMTPHSSTSIRQSFLTPASRTEDIEKLSAMKAYYSQQLETALVRKHHSCPSNFISKFLCHLNNCFVTEVIFMYLIEGMQADERSHPHGNDECTKSLPWKRMGWTTLWHCLQVFQMPSCGKLHLGMYSHVYVSCQQGDRKLQLFSWVSSLIYWQWQLCTIKVKTWSNLKMFFL